jgi:hypothetical protein
MDSGGRSHGRSARLHVSNFLVPLGRPINGYVAVVGRFLVEIGTVGFIAPNVFASYPPLIIPGL